jgi:hypothetical protein
MKAVRFGAIIDPRLGSRLIAPICSAKWRAGPPVLAKAGIVGVLANYALSSIAITNQFLAFPRMRQQMRGNIYFGVFAGPIGAAAERRAAPLRGPSFAPIAAEPRLFFRPGRSNGPPAQSVAAACEAPRLDALEHLRVWRSLDIEKSRSALL